MRNYSVVDLLHGTAYVSKSYGPVKMGVIDYATKRENVWVGSDADAYSVRYTDPTTGERNWATVAVSYGD
jgi:hypothetical protein